MNWTELKKEIYLWDGSWMDIYVQDVTAADWKKWVDFVNENYKLSWHNAQHDKTEPAIDFDYISGFWEEGHEFLSTAKIFIEKLQINVHFFTPSEIENDIDPREFKSMEDHQALIKYLKAISKLLGKEVIVTPENLPQTVLITAKEDNIRYFSYPQ